MTEPHRPIGKLPQWWLDSTPHDTLEEREEKRAAEKKAKVEDDQQQQDNSSTEVRAAPQDAPVVGENGTSNEMTKPPETQTDVTDDDTRQRQRRSPTEGRSSPEEDYEATDYNVERSKLKHVVPVAENDQSEETKGPGEAVNLLHVVDESMEQAPLPSDVLSPVSEAGSTPSSTAASDTPTSMTQRKARHFKTSFTGVSSFDFAMQQRAKEQERREKERLARESLARHHADKVEVERTHQQKQRGLEEKRKKKEAEENLKHFKNVSLEYDKSTELKRQQQEDKRKKKEAEEQIHEYKSSS